MSSVKTAMTAPAVAQHDAHLRQFSAHRFGMSVRPAVKALLTALACCSLCAAALPAFGEEMHSARADALFRQAQTLLDAGKVEAACSKFEASEAAENGLRTLLHLGDCYERVGRTASAWHAFQEAEAVAHAKKDEREQVAAQRSAALEPKLTRVVFVVPSTSRVPGLTVQLGSNTIPAASWGSVIPVDAGAQHISASAKGHRPWSLNFNVVSGESREYRINVPTLSPEAGPNTDHRNILRTAGFVSGGVGVAGIGAGAVFSALSRNADDANTCVRGVIQCTPGNSNRAGYSNAATVSFAVGGTLLATGITLLVLAPAPDNKEQHAPLRVAARVSSVGGRLQLEGAW